MQRLLIIMLACFCLVACTAVEGDVTIPDPADAIAYQVLSSSSLPEVMQVYDNNMHAMLRAKGYRVTQETSYVRVMRPIDEVAQSYDQAAVSKGWEIVDAAVPREQRILRTYRLGTQILLVTLFAEANSRDGVVVVRINADR
ncbi:MAG: hypothetical protein FJ040_10165 [Chloroflexi bacterium]|nr:hypothetical protein [Chloroflexota bacterium]